MGGGAISPGLFLTVSLPSRLRSEGEECRSETFTCGFSPERCSQDSNGGAALLVAFKAAAFPPPIELKEPGQFKGPPGDTHSPLNLFGCTEWKVRLRRPLS